MPDRAATEDRRFADAMTDLDRLRETILDELVRAAASSKSGWHLPMVATGGTQPHNRTVVLRNVDRDAAAIAFHTDARSPKVTQLRVSPHASWCFYDREHRVQLVADGVASVHTEDAVADAGWERSSASSRRCYLAPAAPGDVMEQPQANLPERWIGVVPPIEATEPGRAHFAVVRMPIARLDFLYLSHEGNLRAEFVRDGDGFAGSWIAA